MSKNTNMQWCDSTCNPTMGCDGCELWCSQRKTCYAGMLHTRFGGTNPGYAPRFEKVKLFPGRMAEAAAWSDLSGKQRKAKPWLDDMPRMIFISDMSDALSKKVSLSFLRREIVNVVSGERGQRHIWLWLTKRPQRMAEFSTWLNERGVAWPRNLWAGTSITSSASRNRIRQLSKVGDGTTYRFLSVEPQVEAIDLSKSLRKIDWVIQGGESGPKARPFDIQWAHDQRDLCREHEIPYFLKQLGTHVHRNGKRLTFEDNHVGDWAEWAQDLCVREIPG
jgi:protein gp37